MERRTSNGSAHKRRNDSTNKVVETDENQSPLLHNGVPTKSPDLKTEMKKNNLFSNTSSFKKKMLAERKEELLHDSSISSNSYDPITNYTSPRPKFLRYNPNHRREFLQRIEVEKRGTEEVNDDDDNEEDEEGEEKPFYLYVVFMIGVLLFIFYGMSSSYPSFEGNESHEANNVQKIQGNTPRLQKTLLGNLVSMSQMCPVVGESLCNIYEKLFASLEMDGMIGRQHIGKEDSLIEGIRNELSNKVEVVDLLLKNVSLVEENEEEGDANKFISRVEALGENYITNSSVESLLVSDSLSANREEIFDNISISQLIIDESTPLNDQYLEDFNFSLATDSELTSSYSYNILSKGVLLTFSIFLGSLTVIVGLLSCFHKYFQRPKLNSLPCETREKMVTNVPMKEENLDEALDISVESKSSRLDYVSLTSNHMNVELKEASGFGPPRVELLGEFSLIDEEVTINGVGSYLRKKEYPNSQFSYHQKGKSRKLLSPLPNMLDSSPEVSTSSKFSSKVSADKGEISDTSATSSLRRSNRLRNQNRVI